MLLKGLKYNSVEDAIKNEDVLKHYKSVIDALNKDLEAIETIKKFKLLPKEFSIDKGELTPKLSMKRKVILEHFEAEINEIFKK